MQFHVLRRLALQASVCLTIFSLSFTALVSADTKKASQKTQQAQQESLEANVSNSRKAERLYFAEAQNALNKKQLSRYKTLLPKIKNYPLLPYLEYQEIVDRLGTLPRQDVEQFFNQYPNSFLTERLRHRWLRTLASRDLWSEYHKAYDASLTDPELACFNINALLIAGDKTVLKDVEPLWNIEKNQSNACDPVFAEWKKAGMLTPELLWSRHSKAVKNNELSLANSLVPDMSAKMQAQASLYQKVAKSPRLILQPRLFNTKHSEDRDSIALGLLYFAEVDSLGALEIWQSYAKHGKFTANEITDINYALAKKLLSEDKDKFAEQLVSQTPSINNADLLEALLRKSLRRQDWSLSNRWIQRLPEKLQQSERWSYWQARIIDELHIKDINGKNSNDIYLAVAKERSFYGFISADKLGIPYNLADRPLLLSNELIKQVEHLPGIQRSKEFYLTGDINASVREWLYTTRRLSIDEIVASARLANRWGWHRLAIQTIGDAELWDEVEIRFPVVFEQHIKKASKETRANELLIFAITRQESAFNANAKSSAGALGLMQMLPSTAKETARRYKVEFKEQDLISPEKNIALGSRYLDQLLGSFSENRILVAAAYNAGPGRARKWLNKEEQDKLPYDVWVETIPYKETRSYVQNILAYSVIYGYRTGNKQSFVTADEANQKL